MKQSRVYGIGIVAAVCLVLAMPAGAGTLKCPPDSVKVGNVCIDTYEASVWQIDPTNKSLVNKVQQGNATLADLTRGGATHLSPAAGATLGTCTPDYPANFPKSGNWKPVQGSNPPSPGVYAVSIPGVRPSICITWFQANQACLLSGKRLLTNGEWQGAAAGTPDPGVDDGFTDCNINSIPHAVNTGSRSVCKSSWGVFDMVGNVPEWVADWAQQNNVGCTDWTTAGAGLAGGDESCFGGIAAGGLNLIPAALFRGGSWGSGKTAGVFAVNATEDPAAASYVIGFRCAR
jgi:hypothetical protein